MKTDKGQFDVLSKMVSTPPKKTAEIKAPKPKPSKLVPRTAKG